MNLNLRHISNKRVWTSCSSNCEKVKIWKYFGLIRFGLNSIVFLNCLLLFKDVVYNSYRFSSRLEILKTNLKTKYFCEFDHESDGIPDFVKQGNNFWRTTYFVWPVVVVLTKCRTGSFKYVQFINSNSTRLSLQIYWII